MTEQHPLTDEICDAFWDEHGQYYVLYEEVRLTCRASADWQLEQVIEWLKTTPHYHCGSVMADLLKEAMRPQQQQQQRGNND